jgi:pyruvate dehydrogenase E2 component (dihydrolipoamide acetyltransferase)
VPGSGPEGRVIKRDLDRMPLSVSSPGSRTDGAEAPAGQDRVIPVSKRRAVIARRLGESKFSAPHYYLKTSVDMTGVMEARKILNSSRSNRVSLNAFLMKFAAEALKRHPGVNASWQDDTIIEYGSIDIGLAVDLGDGLITPIVHNCGNKGVEKIDAELVELIEKTSNNALRPEDYTGATFTISNLGSFGIEEFTAIINPPGSAILAVGQTKKTPVVLEDDRIVTRPVTKMTLSCDHRVIDGAAGGRFLQDLRLLMEQPFRLVY